MQVNGTINAQTLTRVYETGNFRGHTEFIMEGETGARPSPHAFLVHQQPYWILPTHYHLEEQFQVVVGGSGTLGRHPLEPISIHYASREAGYGPIVAGPTGLDYLTLRSVTNLGAFYLPEERAKMREGLSKRQESAGPVAVSPSELLAARTQPSIELLIAPDDSGIGAWVLRVGSGGVLRAPAHGNSGGRFHVVIGGTLAQDKPLGASTCVYTSPDEAPMELLAGSGGLEILVLQYPASALSPQPVTITGTR